MSIARVANAYLGTTSALSMTTAFDCGSGANYLIVAVMGQSAAGDNISGVTYNGVAMSLLAKVNDVNNRSNYLFGLASPASGSNNVVISSSPSEFILGLAVSYSGVKITGQPDATNTQVNSAGGSTSLTTAVTTVADNCWAVLSSGMSGRPQSAGTGATKVVEDTTYNGILAVYDSNGVVTPAGSYSMTTTASNGNISHIVASLAPTVFPPLGFGKISSNRKYFLPSEAALVLAALESKRRLSRRRFFQWLPGAFWRK